MSFRYRTTEDGLLVLQVRELEEIGYGYEVKMKGKWRDANITDLPIVEWMTAANEVSPQVKHFWPNGNHGGPK